MGIQERREREKKLRRRQIMDAAKELFLEKGFKGTSIEEIANLAELGPATIYQYFSNKEALYASLNIETLSFLASELEKIKEDEILSPEEKMKGLTRALFKTYLHDPLALRIVYYLQLDDTLLTLSPELLRQLNEVGGKGIRLMASIYEEGVRAGLFRSGNSMAYADIMWSTFAGLVLWEEAKKKLDPERDYLKDTFDLAFEIFQLGIKQVDEK